MEHKSLPTKKWNEMQRRLLDLYAAAEESSFPLKTLHALKGWIPARIHSFITIDAANQRVAEEATLEPTHTSLSTVRKVAGKIAPQHPCIAKLLQQSAGMMVVRLSDLVDFKKWQSTEIYEKVHGPNFIRDQMFGACRTQDTHFAVSLSRDRVFTNEECSRMKLLLPHMEQAWRNSHLRTTCEPEPFCFDDQNFAVHIPADGAEVTWPLPLLAALKRHSQSPVLTFRQPLPEDFLNWFEKVLQATNGNAVPDDYVSEHQGSTLIAHFMPVSGMLPPCITVNISWRKAALSRLIALGLSPREAEVAFWVARGKRNAEIAIIIECGVNTVRKHLQTIFIKLGIETRTELTAIVLESVSPSRRA